MQTPVTPPSHLLLSIPFSHYNEKARWAFAYYGVPYSQHLLLPVFHFLSLRTVANHSRSTRNKRVGCSPYSTPCLVVSSGSPPTADKTFHDSHDILAYLSDKFSGPAHPHLYTCCGVDQADQIKGLEKRYDEVLGVAARSFAYYEMVVLSRWRALIPFALLGFTNGVGLLQSLLWFLWSPLIGQLLVSQMGSTPRHHLSAMEMCRAEFENASQILEESDYLAGSRLSAADITFAALAYPVLGISHEEGYQQYPPSSTVFSPGGQAFVKELRATKAGQHVLHLYKEERNFGAAPPEQKRTLLGLW